MITSLPSTATSASISNVTDHDTAIPSLPETSNGCLLLSNRLLELGKSVPAVQLNESLIATKLRGLWRVLDTLCLRLNSDDSVHNDSALKVIDAMCDDIRRLSKVIERAAPTKSSGGNTLVHRYTVKRRVRSLCKKNGLETLLATLEFLRCTAELLVTVITIAEKVRWNRAFGRGKGRAQANILFQTLRIEDRPAKECLAERVLIVGQAFVGTTDDVVAKILPPFLGTLKQEMVGAGEQSNHETYTEVHARTWWDLLLKEWTKV